MSDPVNHPKHYNSHESGIEAIDICEHMNFCIGNATKYVWRAGQKGDRTEDLRKAHWYLKREVDQRGSEPRTHIIVFDVRVQEKLAKIWATPTPTLLGMYLWALANENLRLALALVTEEIERTE